MDEYHRWIIQKDEEEILDLINAYKQAPSSSSVMPSNRIPCHTSILRGGMYVREVLEGHPCRAKREFRMETHIFHALVKIMNEKCLLRNGKDITVEEQLAMFLYTLGKNSSNRTVQERFQHSGSSVSYYFGEVLNAILQLSREMIRFPSPITPSYILNRSHFYPYFKDCIGAIDGTHVPITVRKPTKPDAYRNRKQSLSQNVMVACDFENHFVYVMSGWEGSGSDASVLKSSIDDGGFHVPQDRFYLVDGGYANTPNFIAPYRGQKYHLREHGGRNQRPRNYKELFNLRHSRLRNHVERIIGVLKMRFQILKVATYFPLDTQRDIVTAATILHNFIVYHNGDMNWPFRFGDTINPFEFVPVPGRNDERYNGDVESLNIQRQAGNQKRDEIARAMWENYSNRRRSMYP